MKDNNMKIDESTDSVFSRESDIEEIVSMEEGDVSENSEIEEQYQSLPIWKKVVLMILCMGALTAVIMLIDFLIEFFIAIVG